MPDTVAEHRLSAVAENALQDTINAQIKREGLDGFDRTPEQDRRVRDICDHWKAEYVEADLAVALFVKAANQGRSTAIIDLLAREHAYLLNEVAWATLKAVSTRISRMGGSVDGRITPALAEFATRLAPPLREGN